MLFADVCAVFFSFWYGVGGEGGFWAFWLLLGALCILGVLALLVLTLVCTRLGSQRCASCWTRPAGGGRWGHYLCYPWGVCWAAQKTACQNCGWVYDFHDLKLYMLALVRWPSLHSYDAYMVYWVQGASWRNCRQKQGETSFSPKKVFLFSRNSRVRFLGLILWYLSIGRARHPGPGPPCHLAIEVFNVGGWHTHGDLALEAKIDFLAVVEHPEQLMPLLVS